MSKEELLRSGVKEFRDFTKVYPGLSSFIIEGTDNMFLIAGPNGEVYYANPKFQSWIGYSNHEFTRKAHPVSWIKFTVPDENLEADVAQAKMTVEGKLKSYRCRKDYLPKNQHARLVEIYVRRYPEEGPFQFFVVDVEPLLNGHERMARNYERLAKELSHNGKEMIRTQKEIAEVLTALGEHRKKDNQREAERDKRDEERRKEEITINSTIKWLRDNPKWGVPVFLFFGVLLFGERAMEFVTAILEKIK